ncbi:TlpA family protein disulfide reductase [Cytobacillus sp. Hm23]
MSSILLLTLLFFHIIIIYIGFNSIKKAQALLQFIADVNPEELQETSLPVGMRAPDFNLQDVNGNHFTLDSFSNKPISMLIVATDCDACSIDKVEFEQAARRYPEFNFLLIIANHKMETSESVHINEHKNYYILKSNDTFLKEFQIKFFPTFIMLNEHKEIVGYPIITEHIAKYSRALT